MPAAPRKIGFWLVTALIGIVAMLGLGEILLGLISPSEYLYPRYQFSAEYGLIPFPNVVMVHGIPRKFEFRYTVNSMNTRGEVVVPHASGLPAVVVLGDSYSFGMGVSDGDEYPAVMRSHLSGRADVVNLGEPGWGLTQEIRRYYDTGAKYDPKIVILQFCANDPDDNLANRVTLVENGRFKFVDSANSLNVMKKYLSRSFLQRTQLYKFFPHACVAGHAGAVDATRGVEARCGDAKKRHHRRGAGRREDLHRAPGAVCRQVTRRGPHVVGDFRGSSA